MFETELEYELEDELEGEDEWELEGEDEFELEDEFEDELEMESEYEFEDEFEDEFEGEEFLGKFFKKIGRKVKGFVKKAAPMLKAIARKAAPLVGTAIGGPAGGLIAGGLSRAFLREGEFEDEFEMEDELEDEFELEDEAEGVMTADDAVAEHMAAYASKKRTRSGSPALMGAAVVATLKPSDRAALRKVLPHMVRGTDILTRLLRQRAITRPAVRTIPTIVRRTAKVLKKRVAQGKPVTRAAAGKAMARQIQRVLGSQRRCTHAISRNLKATRAVARRRRTIRG